MYVCTYICYLLIHTYIKDVKSEIQTPEIRVGISEDGHNLKTKQNSGFRFRKSNVIQSHVKSEQNLGYQKHFDQTCV